MPVFVLLKEPLPLYSIYLPSQAVILPALLYKKQCVSYLFLFSKIYGYDFGQESTAIFERMFEKAYEYAFDNLYLPIPTTVGPI